MIVSTAFPDDSVEVAWQQHDVYGTALFIIATACQHKARIAAAILDVKPPDAALLADGFDHRTLQQAHDIIAAVWRFKANASQMRLGLEEGNTLSMDSWLSWLRKEVASWDDQPSLVRYVIQILGNQNSKVGYRAESRLAYALLERFDHVPWDKSHIELKRRLEDEVA